MSTAAFHDMEEGDAPDTPNTGRWRVYFKTGGLYYIEDDGTEVGPLGPSGAPSDATYIVQTADATLTNEQALSTLATGEMDVTTGTGVVSSRKYNLSASASPTVNDDSSAGYSVGSLWIDTTNSTVWRAIDVSVGAAVWHQIDVNESDEVFVDFIATPTYDDVQDFINLSQSASIWSGGTITDGGSGTIDISAGTGMIKTTDSDIGANVFFDFSAESSVSLTDNSLNWIYIDYNAGSPQVGVAISISSINFHTEIVIGKVYRIGTTLYIYQVGQFFADEQRKICQKDFEVLGIQRATGEILSETGTRNIAITAGVIWCAGSRDTTSSFDSSGADTFHVWYSSASTSADASGVSQIDNANYWNGAALTAMTNNRYGTRWVYRAFDGSVHIQIGTSNAVSLGEAEEETVPTPPSFLADFALLVGRIIIQEGAAVFSAIDSAFEETFTGVPVTDHGDLSGLADDDHTQYLLAGGTRSLTADWDAGSWKIVAEQLESDVATGTAPIVVASTTLVGNLNADQLDGQEGTYYLALANATGTLAHENGGLESDVSAYSGLVAISGGATSEVDTKSELEAQITDVADFAEADGDTYTGVHDFGGATSLEVPNSAAPTVDAAGEVAVDTTVADYTGLMTYHDGTEALFVVAMPTENLSTTDGDVVAYNATNDEFEMVAQSTGSASPTGVLLPYAGSSAPSGWLLCDGSAVSRTTYGDLFTAIGTAFGAGDGSTTFNLPDMRGRMPLGKDDMGGSSANRVTDAAADAVGGVGGAENVTLNSTQIPSNSLADTQAGTTTNRAGSNHTGSGSSAVDNMPPYLTINYIVKT